MISTITPATAVSPQISAPKLISFSKDTSTKQTLLYCCSMAAFLTGLVVGILGIYCYYWAHSSTDPRLPLGSPKPTKKPHIIFILADDLGWSDVSFHGSSQIPTPNIDSLANEGVILNSFYAQYMCTPSRAALLTGKYPTRVGLQHYVLGALEPRGLDLTVKLLPQYLQDAGYKTHMVGKWHLGMYRREMTPLFRGFDSFFGFYSGNNDYYNYTPTAKFPPGYVKFDLWDNLEPGWKYIGQYATELFTEKAVDRILSHNPEDPFFLYLPQIAPHWASFAEPIQAPQKYVDRFPHITHEGRRKYAGSIAALDDSVGQVIAALKSKGMYENSIVVFSSDNGGSGFENAFDDLPAAHASNWPLRGAKTSQWEGGLRVTACIASPLLEKPKRVSNELFHITDWFTTFLRLAGIQKPDEIDGYDIWDSISRDRPSPRTEILHQIDPVWKEYALRWNQYKLVIGSYTNASGYRIDQWYSEEDGFDTTFFDSTAKGAITCEDLETAQRIPCAYTEEPCLYDIHNDPCEYRNIAADKPDIVGLLMVKLNEYNRTALPSRKLPRDPRSQASLTGGLCQPWSA
ncbi:Arylsulfatase I [Hypsibius exemplaris]|uniref:Arylsulfatase I n=1 Tax=Hypsibius exemplaris TaxID=2072580 RepID=A0A1W0WRM2_HYPEX|nr:Arylsulfatase I [Hypsibius exemplaris]